MNQILKAVATNILPQEAIDSRLADLLSYRRTVIPEVAPNDQTLAVSPVLQKKGIIQWEPEDKAVIAAILEDKEKANQQRECVKAISRCAADPTEA